MGKLTGSASKSGSSKKGKSKAGMHEVRPLLSTSVNDAGGSGVGDGNDEDKRDSSTNVLPLSPLRLKPPAKRMSGEEYEEKWANLCGDVQEQSVDVAARPQLRDEIPEEQVSA